MEFLTKDHLLYVMHNVIRWERKVKINRHSIKSIANACANYDSNYTAADYEKLIKAIGLKKCLNQI